MSIAANIFLLNPMFLEEPNEQIQITKRNQETTLNRRLWISILGLTAVLELITLALRFGFKLESTRDTASTIGRITFGIRIHHGYCGAVVLLVAWGLSQTHAKVAQIGYVVGWSLLLSDMIHHFLVLWPITGSPQFDFLYPP